MKLHFIKMHALGNDFILIDDRSARLKKISQLSKKLCSRRFGIGADQLLLLCKSKTSDFKMRIFNADSSEVEMCGNGIRCLAKYIWDEKIRTQKHLSIETLAGIIHLQKTGKLIKVDMGEPILEPEKIPVNLKQKSNPPLPPFTKGGRGGIINHPLKINDRVFKITCVSMGNPHAIIVVKDVHSVPLIHYGPIIENYRFFPNRTNVEFIQILNRKNIRMRVWERGAGETMACGTGASAAGVASALLGLTERKVTVHLPGGKLLIEWSEKNNHVYMTGPAVKVFEGRIEI
jgi:diaminopimelate epimerase